MDDYKVQIDQAKQILDGVIGNTITSAYLHIVEPEINQVILCLDNDVTITVFPGCGGEVINVASITSDKLQEMSQTGSLTSWVELDEYNSKVLGYRFIGEPWNGHGVEFDFGHSNLIIEVVEGVPAPDGYYDCLRIAIYQYTYKYETNDTNEFEDVSPICFRVDKEEIWIPETIFSRIIHIFNAYQLHYGQVLDSYSEFELNWQQVQGFMKDLEFIENIIKDKSLEKYISEIRNFSKLSIYRKVSMNILGN